MKEFFFVSLFILQIFLYGFYNGYYYNKTMEIMVYFFPLLFSFIYYKNIKYKLLKKSQAFLIMLVLLYPLITNVLFYLEIKNFLEYIKFCYNILFIYVFPYIIVKSIPFNYKERILNIYYLILKINIITIFFQVLLVFLGRSHNFFWQYASRPSGLLAEPSFQFYFCIPLLYLNNEMELLSKKWRILLFISLICTFSLNNIILVILIEFLTIKKKKIIINSLLIGTFSIFLTIFLFSDHQLSNFKNYNFTRLENSLKMNDTSTLHRIKRPFRIFIANDKKIVGLGIKNEEKIKELIDKTNFEKNEIYEISPLYMNGFFKELNFFGLLGTFIIQILYFGIIFRKYKYFSIALFILRMGSGISYNSGIIIFYIILLSLEKEKTRENINESRINIWNKARSHKNVSSIS